MQIEKIVDTNYFITSEGKVLNYKFEERKLKLTKTGYFEISLKRNSDQKLTWYRVHRLVAQAFIINSENKPFVNHKDGNKINNNLTNLEWVTHQENMEHAKNFSLVHRAEQNHNTIHTTEQVEEICKLLALGYRNVDVAKTVGTTHHNVSMIRTGICWQHISCKYNIPSKSRSLSCETIHWICQKIVEGLTQGEILSLANNRNITKNIIKDIRRGRIYRDISKLYNI